MDSTLAERIRERARNYFRELAQSRPGNCIWCDVIHSANCAKETTLIDDCAAFALSELSAVEEAARKEEREQCCKVICRYCNDTTVGKAELFHGKWGHRIDSEHYDYCKAAAIRTTSRKTK